MLIPPAQLHRLTQEASVVVTHGGPASIAEVRRLGRLPVVVPRDPARGEHVDGHQQRFSRRMAERGWLVLCETQEQLTAALDAGMADPSRFLLHGSDDSERVAASVDAVSRILDEVVAAARTGVAARRRAQLVFRHQATDGRRPSPPVPAQMAARELADSGEGAELS
jgi:Glycosyltransferase family 28 C-terminal domain